MSLTTRLQSISRFLYPECSQKNAAPLETELFISLIMRREVEISYIVELSWSCEDAHVLLRNPFAINASWTRNYLLVFRFPADR